MMPHKAVVVHPHRIAGQHFGQLRFNQFPDVVQRLALVRDFPGEFITQFPEIDFAEIHREAFSLVIAGRLGADRLIDDFVQFLEHG
ncbi:MAG: hypothetical protein MUF04_01845, partial [Akkermansiaceae bacterium]|nr:hypothetical protein [Akkermansiaceae bacterium]